MSLSKEEIFEIGQSDFEITVKDYRLAKISWQFFLSATDNLSDEKPPLIEAIEGAYLARSTDYLLNLCIYDSLMAICRLTDERGKGGRISLLRIKGHLDRKREELLKAGLDVAAELEQISDANSEIKEFRKSEISMNLRKRRDAHLAHRLENQQLPEVTNGELDILIGNLDAIFCKLAPLFRAAPKFPVRPAEQYDFHIQKFWKAVELGAPKAKLAPTK